MNPTVMGRTFAEFIRDAAEALNIARYSDANDGLGSVARVPDDEHDLDVCKRVVNNAYKRLLQGTLPGVMPYITWTFLRPTFSLVLSPDGTGPTCIAGDPSRYRLPSQVQAVPMQFWHISDPTSTAPASRCDDTSIDRVRARLLSDTTTGVPVLAGIAPLMSTGAPGVDDSGWEVVFYRKPDRAYTASARCRLMPRDMRLLGERPVSGPQHDLTLSYLVIAEAKRRDAGDPRRTDYQEAERAAMEALRGSIAMDKENHPRRLGPLSDPSTEGRDTMTRMDAVYMMGPGPIFPNG